MNRLKVGAILFAGCFGVLCVAIASGVTWTAVGAMDGIGDWRDFDEFWWAFGMVILIGPFSMFLAAVPMFLFLERKIRFTTLHAILVGGFVAGMTPFLITLIDFGNVANSLRFAHPFALAGAIAAPPTWGLYILILGTSRRHPNLTSPG